MTETPHNAVMSFLSARHPDLTPDWRTLRHDMLSSDGDRLLTLKAGTSVYGPLALTYRDEYISVRASGLEHTCHIDEFVEAVGLLRRV